MVKRIIVLIAVVTLMLAGIASASLFDDHSTNQQQGQTATGGNQQQGQGIEDSGNSSNRNTNTNLLGNDQDQKQGQIGINKQGQDQGQGQFAVGKVNVQDNSEYKSYAFSPPAIHAQKGTSTANMYSIFGGIGLSQTEEYTVAIEKIAVIERLQGLGYITAEEAKAEALETYKELDSASQPKRILGIFGKTRGRHLLNGFGMLAWDSFYKEGQKTFSKSGEWKKKEIVEDTLDSYEGNEGIIN